MQRDERAFECFTDDELAILERSLRGMADPKLETLQLSERLDLKRARMLFEVEEEKKLRALEE